MPKAKKNKTKQKNTKQNKRGGKKMALKEVKDTKAAAKPASNVSKDEQIGFHKGALSTLAKEREEMLKILNIVEQLMQMHVAAMKELGVDLEKMAQNAQASAKAPGKTAPLERKL